MYDKLENYFMTVKNLCWLIGWNNVQVIDIVVSLSTSNFILKHHNNVTRVIQQMYSHM